MDSVDSAPASVGAFSCVVAATVRANSPTGNGAHPCLGGPWHTAPRCGSGFSLRSFLPEPPERPRHRDLGGYGVAGFFFGSGQRSSVPLILPGTMGLCSCGCSCCSLPSPD
jgi:hypothetical protein